MESIVLKHTLTQHTFICRERITNCSRQNESVKSATVDIRIEFDYKENVPANTAA